MRISSLLSALKAHASEAASRNPGEVAFQAVMEWAKSGKDDKPPAPPEGLLSAADDQPTYSKMMITLLDQVNKAVDEKKPDDRYKAMLEEVQGHEVKVRKLQAELIANLETLQKEEGKKITSEAYHDGFSSSHVAKSQPGESTGQASRVELLNPNMPPTDSLPAKDSGVEVDEDDEVQSSAAGEKFGSIGMSDYQQSLQFLTQNPQLLIERETDGLLVKAFDAALEKKEDLSRQYVHQALLLQYCRALGRDGVGIFFKRITTKGHQAQEVFYKDVQETYMRIKNRSREIIAERAKEGTEGVEQIQLHAMEPGQVIQIKIPPADSEDVEAQEAREIFEGFEPDMKKALATGDLDQVNEVLGRMKVDEAEELVNLLGQVCRYSPSSVLAARRPSFPFPLFPE